MQDNHYTPPSATVEDVAPQDAGPAPPKVTLAVRLLWVSLGLGLVGFVFDLTRAKGFGPGVAMGVFGAALFGLVAYLNISIQRGRNWARVVTLIFVLLSLLMLALAPSDPEVTVIEQLANGVSTLLDVIAMVLLFTQPAAGWFRAAARA